VCQSVGAIANITSGVLLANSRFTWVAAPLAIAIAASLLAGVLERQPAAARRRPATSKDSRGGRRKEVAGAAQGASRREAPSGARIAGKMPCRTEPTGYQRRSAGAEGGGAALIG
jgi:hypothetical protein